MDKKGTTLVTKENTEKTSLRRDAESPFGPQKHTQQYLPTDRMKAS